MKNIKEPFVMILVGPTLSGKSTFIRKNYPDVDVISRDEIVMQLHGSRDYNTAFKEVDQKMADRILSQRLSDAGRSKKNVIIDMTNMTAKRRRQSLANFGSEFEKIAVVFPILSDDEYERRNIERNAKESKWIPPHVIKSMVDSYEVPTVEEGFDSIFFV